MRLHHWAIDNKPADNMCYEKGFWAQIMFMRDTLSRVIAGKGKTSEEVESACTVIGTHTSKSIKLPVYRLENKEKGLVIILRDNFHNWKMSVISEIPIVRDFQIFYDTPPIEPDYTGDELHPVYFEGFPEDLIFGYQKESDGRKWSAEISNNYDLYFVIKTICIDLGISTKPVWRTRESHKAELLERGRRI